MDGGKEARRASSLTFLLPSLLLLLSPSSDLCLLLSNLNQHPRAKVDACIQHRRTTTKLRQKKEKEARKESEKMSPPFTELLLFTTEGEKETKDGCTSEFADILQPNRKASGCACYSDPPAESPTVQFRETKREGEGEVL